MSVQDSKSKNEKKLWSVQGADLGWEVQDRKGAITTKSKQRQTGGFKPMAQDTESQARS